MGDGLTREVQRGSEEKSRVTFQPCEIEPAPVEGEMELATRDTGESDSVGVARGLSSMSNSSRFI